VILLEFWDTHCSPCILLMPDFEKLTQKYKDNKDVAIINVNAGWETEQSARTFIQKRAFKLNYAYMEKANSKRMKVNELPCTIIIDRDFNIRYKHIGLNEEKETNIISEFEKEIENLRVDK
jgi:thiol-disulfide isomerase/thioredoxin